MSPLIALLLACQAPAPVDSGSPPDSPPISPTEDCSDGVDNDSNLLVDCQDPACRNLEICDEICGGDEDVDGDGAAGCLDTECRYDPACQEDCYDGQDNDLDGLIDCLDDDCKDADCDEICDDGIDNDWDGLRDCWDPDCLPSTDCREICDGGVDEDDDGLVDCEDADCFGSTACTELCDSETDEDLDGFVDCADEDCWGLAPCEAEKEVTLLQATIDRRQGDVYSGHPSFYTSYLSFEGTLRQVSGMVRYPTDPAQALSTATAFKSCSFQLDTWNTSARFRKVSSEISHNPLDVHGLVVDSDCPELSADNFLPDAWNQGPSAKGWSQGLAGTQIARNSEDGVIFEPWFSGSAVYDQSSSTFSNSMSSFYRHGKSSWFSGSVVGVAPFVWVPRDSRF